MKRKNTKGFDTYHWGIHPQDFIIEALALLAAIAKPLSWECGVTNEEGEILDRSCIEDYRYEVKENLGIYQLSGGRSCDNFKWAVEFLNKEEAKREAARSYYEIIFQDCMQDLVDFREHEDNGLPPTLMDERIKYEISRMSKGHLEYYLKELKMLVAFIEDGYNEQD